jgi:putative zinc finger protein
MSASHSLSACKAFEQDLVLYHYGECSSSEKQRIESHLQSCAGCRRFLDELKTLLPSTVESDDPPANFWQDYSRELRIKLSDLEEKPGWWRSIAALFRPWPVPALATAAILAVAITMTLNRSHETTPKPDETPYSYMASNADFLKSMDLLDSMDILESVEPSETQKGETTSHNL